MTGFGRSPRNLEHCRGGDVAGEVPFRVFRYQTTTTTKSFGDPPEASINLKKCWPHKGDHFMDYEVISVSLDAGGERLVLPNPRFLNFRDPFKGRISQVWVTGLNFHRKS